MVNSKNVKKTKRSNNSRNNRKKKITKRSNQLTYVCVGVILYMLLAVFAWGFLGILAANLLRIFVGDLYRWFGIIVTVLCLYFLFKQEVKIPINARQLSALSLLSICFLVMFSLMAFSDKNALLNNTWQSVSSDLVNNTMIRSAGGGLIGSALASVFIFLFSEIGTYVVLFILILLSVFLASNQTLSSVITAIKDYRSKRVKQAEQKSTSKNTKDKSIQTSNKKAQSTQKTASNKLLNLFDDSDESDPEELMSAIETTDNRNEQNIVINTFSNNHVEEVETVDSGESTDILMTSARQEIPDQVKNDKQEDVEQDTPLQVHFTNENEDKDYKLPPIDLLQKASTVDQTSEYELIRKNSQILEETFKNFGVNARVISANLGPSVTKFEVQPAAGVKVSRIVNLTDDIALALAAKDIRIEAPIPGKTYIGIEVPNQTTSPVSFREMIEATSESSSILEVPLGRDISGSVKLADLSKMPHLLVAGATGSGKSVAINGMITSILMKAKPHEVKLMMVDPKKVELSVYNGIPHLLTPVVTNPRRAAQALQKVVQEMERRYEQFAQTGMRNIIGYNEYVEQYNQTAFDNHVEPLTKMPYIVVIVDELADLMMVASNEVEAAIIRLAQMARAAGIHMVLATQRPSVDVITGLIKANVPSRMAFAVSSSIDSRTIIDSNGAEKLLGRGDMLFMPMGENKPVRIQGAYLSDSEVEKVVTFVKNQQEAHYIEEMMPTDEPVGGANEFEDEIFGEVVEFLIDQDFISVSMLQRRFRIGFNRAARLMDELEAKGYVSAAEGTKPRRVLQQGE